MFDFDTFENQKALDISLYILFEGWLMSSTHLDSQRGVINQVTSTAKLFWSKTIYTKRAPSTSKVFKHTKWGNILAFFRLHGGSNAFKAFITFFRPKWLHHSLSQTRNSNCHTASPDKKVQNKLQIFSLDLLNFNEFRYTYIGSWIILDYCS